MLMIRAIIRPEKTDEVKAALLEAGYPAVTKMEVYGRGKQRGLKVGNVTYDELPKEMLMIVAPDFEKDLILRTILDSAKTGETGSFGDGKVFISPVDDVYTVSSGTKEA